SGSPSALSSQLFGDQWQPQGAFATACGQPLEDATPPIPATPTDLTTPGGHACGSLGLSEAATRVLALMGSKGVWITDALHARSGLAIPQLCASLLELELARRVRRTASGSGYEVLS